MEERDALLLGLRRQFLPRRGVEDLVIDHAGRWLSAGARVVRMSADPEAGWAHGQFTWQAQWHCPDPLRYGPEVSVTSILTPPTGGLALPATLPATFPASYRGGLLTADNTGDANAHATYTLRGAQAFPGIILNGATDQQRVVTYPFSLAEDDVLVIDTRRGAAFLNGEYRAPTPLTARTIDLVLPFGPNTVAATGAAGSGAPSLTVTFRPANW